MKKSYLSVFYIFILSLSSIAGEYKMEQVKNHSRAEDCWIVIKGKVYDITRYIPQHPAPRNVLTKYCGKKADTGWNTKDRGSSHSSYAERLLKQYEIGTLQQ